MNIQSTEIANVLAAQENRLIVMVVYIVAIILIVSVMTYISLRVWNVIQKKRRKKKILQRLEKELAIGDKNFEILTNDSDGMPVFVNTSEGIKVI